MNISCNNPEYAKTASDRNNYANMQQLQTGCDNARRILRRKRSNDIALRAASGELLKSVRSLRSWLSTANDQVRWLNRCLAIERGKRLKAEREIEEMSCKLAKEGKL